jgi:hypothetical protein
LKKFFLNLIYIFIQKELEHMLKKFVNICVKLMEISYQIQIMMISLLQKELFLETKILVSLKNHFRKLLRIMKVWFWFLMIERMCGNNVEGMLSTQDSISIIKDLKIKYLFFLLLIIIFILQPLFLCKYINNFLKNKMKNKILGQF